MHSQHFERRRSDRLDRGEERKARERQYSRGLPTRIAGTERRLRDSIPTFADKEGTGIGVLQDDCLTVGHAFPTRNPDVTRRGTGWFCGRQYVSEAPGLTSFRSVVMTYGKNVRSVRCQPTRTLKHSRMQRSHETQREAQIVAWSVKMCLVARNSSPRCLLPHQCAKYHRQNIFVDAGIPFRSCVGYVSGSRRIYKHSYH